MFIAIKGTENQTNGIYHYPCKRYADINKLRQLATRNTIVLAVTIELNGVNSSDQYLYHTLLP